MIKKKENKKRRLLALGFLSAPLILKWKQIALVTSIILILFAVPVSPEDVIEGHWRLLDDDTVTLQNESWNLSIGINETTNYKLNVDGTSYFNDTINIPDSSNLSFASDFFLERQSFNGNELVIGVDDNSARKVLFLNQGVGDMLVGINENNPAYPLEVFSSNDAVVFVESTKATGLCGIEFNKIARRWGILANAINPEDSDLAFWNLNAPEIVMYIENVTNDLILNDDNNLFVGGTCHADVLAPNTDDGEISISEKLLNQAGTNILFQITGIADGEIIHAGTTGSELLDINIDSSAHSSGSAEDIYAVDIDSTGTFDVHHGIHIGDNFDYALTVDSGLSTFETDIIANEYIALNDYDATISSNGSFLLFEEWIGGLDAKFKGMDLYVEGDINATGDVIASSFHGDGGNLTNISTASDDWNRSGTTLYTYYDGDGIQVNGSTQLNDTLTVGADDTGHDVKFYGATTGNFMLYDESADKLSIVNSESGGGDALGVRKTDDGTATGVRRAALISSIFSGTSDSARAFFGFNAGAESSSLSTGNMTNTAFGQIGGRYWFRHYGTGNVSECGGASSETARQSSSAGNITIGYNMRSEGLNGGTGLGKIINAYGFLAEDGTGNIDNQYGLKIENQTAGNVENYAIKTGTGLHEFGDDVNISGALWIDYITDGASMDGYNGNIAINGTTGLMGTKLLDGSWYWR